MPKDDRYEFRQRVPFALMPVLVLKEGRQAVVRFVTLHSEPYPHDAVHYFLPGDAPNSSRCFLASDFQDGKYFMSDLPSEVIGFISHVHRIPEDELVELQELERQLERERPDFRTLR